MIGSEEVVEFSPLLVDLVWTCSLGWKATRYERPVRHICIVPAELEAYDPLKNISR